MRRREVATSFLMFKDKILLLRRSKKVSTYKGLWAGVSGSIEKGEKPIERAIKEIKEETGLKDGEFKLVKKGKFFAFEDENLGIKWVVHPFLFEVKTDKIKLDWENKEAKWIKVSELKCYKTVPKLREAFKRVWIGVK